MDAKLLGRDVFVCYCLTQGTWAVFRVNIDMSLVAFVSAVGF